MNKQNRVNLATCVVALQKLKLTVQKSTSLFRFFVLLAFHRDSRDFKQGTSQGGYIVLLNVLIFLAITFFIMVAIAAPLISSNRASAELIKSKKAFMVANSAVEDTLYKMKNQMTVGSSESLTLSGTTAQVTVADTFDGKTVTVSGIEDDVERDIQVAVTETTGVSFNYGLQAGQGGFEMSGGAAIYGNVYSNGPVVGNGGPFVTGSVTVANGSDPVLDVSNTGSLPPAQGINFGGDTTPQDTAQSFQVSTTTEISGVRILIKKSTTNWMNNVTARIVTDNGGKPSKTTLKSTTISAGQVTTSYNYITLLFSNLTLTPGQTYWLVFDASTSWGSYYSLGATSATYADGIAKTGSWSSGNGGTWSDTSPAGLDIFLSIYAGGDTGLVSGIYVGASGGSSTVWAHEINNTYLYYPNNGIMYCQAGSGNNEACDTSRPDPEAQPLPISDGNIADWKAEAEAGGTYVGDISVGSWPNVATTTGLKKIDGDLEVISGGVITVTGTLWVTGDIRISGGGSISLSSSLGGTSGVIVTDGTVTATGGGRFEGNGSAGSYLLVVTTSDCPASPSCSGDAAVEVSGGTGAVVLNAQQGTIEFSGGAQAKQATAKKIEMSGGTSVHYETGLADMNFNSGPSGSWGVEAWDEI